MSTPGIADPYWYEWYVGIEQLIRMLNPDNKIDYVMFQSDVHNTIDDVVVGYNDKQEICYQVKHEIGNQGRVNLTFSKLIESTTSGNGNEKVSLIRALALGWKEAINYEEKSIVPILYTNRKLGVNNTTRTFDGKKYNALPLATFMETVLEHVKDENALDDVEKLLIGKDLLIQWQEFKAAIDDDTIVVEFLKNLEIKSNEGSLEELEEKMARSLATTFKCNRAIAENLFEKLCSKLRIWATTRRENTKVTVEDLYDALSLNNDVEYGEHELPYPTPFFESRENYAQDILDIVKKENRKVIWISGNPGSGKTSLISYLQLKHNLFTARYHTFKPISPEQKYYNNDAGLCRQESLWNDLLIQLRKKVKGNLHKYNIPVINALCTVEQMRGEVMRLSQILYELTGTKTVICIDGIDHAARANNEITFLNSLFRPEEISTGVVFIIVGQPAKFYENYPMWLKSETDLVKYCLIPNLEQEDIKKLLDDSHIDFNIENEVLAGFIYEKTQGNNLSVVFAIEEAKQCSVLDDYKKILDNKHVSEDITIYYSHIWKYVSDYLNSKSLGIVFPDKLLASLIILLNGRLNLDVLHKAIKVDLMKEDWEELLDLLYPIMQKINTNEYVLFHNDFRVFLTANNSDGAKFRATAFQLAEYYMSVDLDRDGLVNIIPLLMSAQKKEMIVKVFNPDYIIHSLAYGMSIKNLEEQAILAYEAVMESKKWVDFHSVYLAIFTLYQHNSYFEYYDKSYNLIDKSYVKTLSPFELRAAKLNEHNLETYRDMFIFCKDLLSLEDPISKVRAESTYNLWTKDLTPVEFVDLLEEDDASVFDRNILEDTFELWGTLAARLDKAYLKIKENIKSKTFTNQQLNSMAIFNNYYFKYHLEHSDSVKALDVVNNGGVSLNFIKENLLDLLLNKKSYDYIQMIDELTKRRELSEENLLAYVCLIFNERNIPFIEVSKFGKIKYIIEDTNLKMVMLSIIAGYQSVNSDISIDLSKVVALIEDIERKDHEYDYLRILIRHGFLLGRIINEGRSGLVGTVPQSLIIKSYEDFLEYNSQHNSFDSRNSFEILLFISLNQVRVFNNIDKKTLLPILEHHLYGVKQLGMFYKSIILDYLVENSNIPYLENYMIELYGENGENIFKEGNFEETHKKFGPYLKITHPDLFIEINNKLMWDVIGYSNHKEYALWPLLEYFKEIVNIDASEWKTRGIELYKLSNIVEIKGSNRAFSEIQGQISEAAAKSGVEDVWSLRSVDEDYRFSLDLLCEELLILLKDFTDIEDLMLTWVMSCGTLSWYNSEDRRKIEKVYINLVSRAKELGYEEIENILNEISPEHVKIAFKTEHKSYTNPSKTEYKVKVENENKELADILSTLKTSDIIDFFKSDRELYSRWSSLEIAWDIIDSREELNVKIAEQFKSIVFSRLETYSWENSGSERIIKKLITFLKEKLVWELALYNLNNFNIGDSFYTFKSNMNFILRLLVEDISKEHLIYIFDEELKCHHKWISGCEHININYEFLPQESNLLKPGSFMEYVINILLDQIASRNIHRIEIALLGIDMLIKYFPKAFDYISDSWNLYNPEQKQFLILMAEKWVEENIHGLDVVYPHLVSEFLNTNELDKKIQLYLIIQKYNVNNLLEQEVEDYIAKPVEYHLDRDILKIFNQSKVSVDALRFLTTMEMLNGINNDDVRYFINKNKIVVQQKTWGSHLRNGDSLLFHSSYSDLDMKILYGEELKQRWSGIPIGYKAQTLLKMDDPWIISKVPTVDYDSHWDIEKQLSEYVKEKQLMKCKPFLKEILHKDTQNEMLIIGGAVWYPINSNEGVIYFESSKVIFKDILIKGYDIKRAVNSRDFIASSFEKGIEMFEIEDEYFEDTGVSLVNELVGTSVFIYGNTMMYPSKIFTDLLNLKPVKGNPLRWENAEGVEVIYFEYYTNPTRDTNQEHYYRQPLMARWLCKKSVVEELVSDLQLSLYTADRIEPMNGRNI